MNIGVIGLGKMGLLHAGIVNSLPDAKVTSVCERDFFLSTAAKAGLPKQIAVYRNAQKMISEQDLDAVYVTTPIGTHVPIINDLLQENSNLSVFVEKPLGASSEEAQLACEAARRTRGVNMVGFQRRFSPVFRKAKELLASEVVGEPVFFRGYCLSSDVLREGSGWRSKRPSGGVLLDSAPHLLDCLMWFFNEPTSVAAVKKSVYSSQVEDYVHALLSYESGLLGHIDLCWSISNYRIPEVLLEIHGKNGMLTVTDDFVRVSTGKQVAVSGNQIYRKQSFHPEVPFLLTEPEYTLEDVAFLEAVHTKAAPETSFVQAAKVNALIDRILDNAT